MSWARSSAACALRTAGWLASGALTSPDSEAWTLAFCWLVVWMACDAVRAASSA